jgi:hypothetical protein
MNGQFKWECMKDMWWVVVGGIPISFLFYYSTRFSYEHFGYFWNIRLIGFGIGTVVFGIMSWSLLDEIPTLKTIICLMLAASIVLIQVTNVIK